MRVVLDTNVLVSGLLLPDSVPGRILQAWRSAAFILVMSEPLLDELARVLAYPKISKRLGWSQETLDRFLLLLRFFTDVADIGRVQAEVPADPQDSFVLATFLAGRAEYLVSGDEHLLSLDHSCPKPVPENRMGVMQ